MSTKRKALTKVAQPVARPNARAPTKYTIDESRAAVSSAGHFQPASKSKDETIEISSDSDSSDADSDDAEEDHDGALGVAAGQVNGHSKTSHLPSPNHTSPRGDGEVADSDDESTSPTFGERLRETIDVPAVLAGQADTSNKALVVHQTLGDAAPMSLSSLSTVLTQALRTDDIDLLESCLQVQSVSAVQQTIERLESSLAGGLLTHLATRIHRRPGRAGTLMAWVKWILVVHGGALASQPDVLKRLVALQKVLSDRSKGLPSLLALKGKLDMLEAQMQLRRSRQSHGKQGLLEDGLGEDDDDAIDAIYVEGEDETAALPVDEEENVKLPLTNGFPDDSDDDVDDSEEDAASDDAASAQDSADEDEVDHDDVEDSMDDDEESEGEPAPPAKVQKTSASFGKRAR